MTMLNGEPVDTGVPAKAAPAVSAPAGAAAPAPSQPIRVGGGTDPTNRSMAQIFGILAVVMGVAVPPLGIILGLVTRSMLKPEKSPLTTWAIVLGIVFSALWLIGTIAFIALMIWTATITNQVVNSVQ
jgi:hypothetical protein